MPRGVLPMPEKIYIGLGVTYHDPAIAIVDEKGTVLFAEAAERSLQYKRGLNCPPDPFPQIGGWLQRYCDPRAHWVIAFNWRKRRPWYEPVSRWLGYFTAPGLMARGYRDYATFLEKYKLFHMLACQNVSRSLGGLNLVRQVCECFPGTRLDFKYFNHHDCHAALACLSSPFSEAACLIVDSYGERGAIAAYHYNHGKIKPLYTDRNIASLGFFYMWLTELCGFNWWQGEEGKVMGLASYGKVNEAWLRQFEKMLWVEGLGLHQNLTAILAGIQAFEKIRRQPQAPVLEAADLARTGQVFFSRLVTQLINNLHERHPCNYLSLGGGCALNSVTNGQLLANTPFTQLHVPSAPADDGTALGAAWLAWRQDHPDADFPDGDRFSPYVGGDIDSGRLQRLIRFGGLSGEYLPGTICEAAASLLAEGKLIGWVQGRAEFGPRALGNRSILADPRDRQMKDKLNARVKFREAFRPFAPAILDEYGAEYFQDYQVSPYMEKTLRFRSAKANRAPAVVHVDGTGRVQSVRREWNPRFHQLLSAFHRQTGVPILLNTSFNQMGKPIVHSVEDAVAVFMTSGLDALVIGDYLFQKPHA